VLRRAGSRILLDLRMSHPDARCASVLIHFLSIACVHAVITFRGRHRGSQRGVVEGGATCPEVPAPSESNPQGEE
jgi:hypothetical protein